MKKCNLDSRCCDRVWLGMALALFGIAILGLWQTPRRINHDVAAIVDQAGLLLDGATPYCGFFDINPPLITYLNVPPVALARACDVSPIIVFQCFMIGLLLLSGIEIFHLVRKPRLGLSSIGRGLVLLAWFAAYFVVDGRGDAGQREHLFVLLYMPYLLLRILRHRGGSTSGWFAVLLGVQAALGASLKPYFLVAAVGMEIVLLLLVPRRRTLLRPENFAVVAVLAVYLMHWLFVPAAMIEGFFGRWLPLTCRGYGAYNVSYDEVADRILAAPISLVSLLAALAGILLAMRHHTRRRHPLLIMAAMVGAGVLLVFAQHKGFTYHRIPLETAGLLCVAMLAARDARNHRNGRRAFAVCVSASVFLAVLISVCFAGRENARPDPPAFVELRRIVGERSQPGDRVVVIATSVRPAYPMLLQMDRKPGSRYLYSMPIAFFYAGIELTEAGRPVYRSRQEASAEEQRFLDDLHDDVAQLQPRLVVVQNSNRWLGLPAGFNTFEYLAYCGWAKESLAAYRELPGPKDWKVFERE